jgi:uncharacterized protein (UPF0548 family)
MPRRQQPLRVVRTAARWPLGVGLTAARYLWRTTPVHRWEMAGTMDRDCEPALPEGIDRSEIQAVDDGVGPLLHRLYRTRIKTPRLRAEELIRCLGEDLDQMAPSEFASFQKLHGEDGSLSVGDEFVVRMPGPWDGPVQVIAVAPTSFRLATLKGHLEAGQIEFRAERGHRGLDFVIESWARSGDRFSDLLYTHVRLAKEIQLHMWTSVLERVVRIAGGTMDGGIRVTTKLVVPEEGSTAAGARRPSRNRRLLKELANRSVNFEPPRDQEERVAGGWRSDDMTERLPPEPSGPPVEGGTFEVVRDLMIAYQVADPDVVQATYARDARLEGRDMLLTIKFWGLRLHMGVRVGEVYDEAREVDGEPVRVFGWGYSTLEGHFEEGTMYYEVWKWLASGEVEFRLHAVSRPARTGPPLLRLGFRLIGRRQQLDFYRQACRRMRRLAEAELELREHQRLEKEAAAAA